MVLNVCGSLSIKPRVLFSNIIRSLYICWIPFSILFERAAKALGRMHGCLSTPNICHYKGIMKPLHGF